ncbi:helix-turn-helix domain-containing protein [Priestia megaterium]|uniref:helix-turn-helix transcriptional regulator n=1 Tax=Priestia megaterium TaxID=1404 RepID=UPI0015A96159|nr:helix-turn-helix transcriptional regulator [Priestia megaterium]MBU8757295.1 helix-turn-helix domain-containing protein [Priestia megaterium]QLC90799.1 helix-turn-helix transcriptional regulator [Priestia megaterium]
MTIEELKEYIGLKIKEYRKVRRITTAELGKLSNTSQATISAIERGTRFGTFESMLNICDVLEISLYDILPSDYTQKVNLNNSNEDKQAHLLLENLTTEEIQVLKNLVLNDFSLLKVLNRLDSQEKKHLTALFDSVLNKS